MADTKIAYHKHWFVTIALVFEAILAILFLEALLDVNSIIREFWLVLCPLVGGVMFVLMVPPIFTNHSLTPRGVRLRMGLLVDQEIPYHAIQQVKETSVTRGILRLGIGVKYFPITRQLFVTSAFTNLVSLKLQEPVQIGKFRKHSVEEIVLNVTFPRGFLDSIETFLSRPGEG